MIVQKRHWQQLTSWGMPAQGFLDSGGRIFGGINRVLLPLHVSLEDETSQRNIPPYSFGTEIAKHSKDYVEQVQAITSTLPIFEVAPVEEQFQGSKSSYS